MTWEDVTNLKESLTNSHQRKDAKTGGQGDLTTLKGIVNWFELQIFMWEEVPHFKVIQHFRKK